MKATNEASFTLLSSIKTIFWKVVMTMGENDMSSSTSASRQKGGKRNNLGHEKRAYLELHPDEQDEFGDRAVRTKSRKQNRKPEQQEGMKNNQARPDSFQSIQDIEGDAGESMTARTSRRADKAENTGSKSREPSQGKSPRIPRHSRAWDEFDNEESEA